MLDYLLKSGVCLAVFYLFYKLLLEKEPIHNFKRIYLLGGLLLAFAIPLITFTTTIEIEPIEIINYGYPELTFDQELLPDAAPINFWPIIIWTVYVFGVVLFALKFLFNLFQINSTIRKNTKQKVSPFTHVLIEQLSTPHTFFNFIFLNKQRYLQQQIPQEVFWHEETHAKQKHSLDVVLLELIQVVFWFNPLLYFIKKDIKLNHEFLADRAVLNKGVSLTTYQEILLAFSSNQTEPVLANALNYSSIKKRFTIMKTKTSQKTAWIKSLILLPLVAVLIYSFSEEKIIKVEASNKTVQIDLEDVNNLKVNYSKTQNLEIPDIEIDINKNKEILINGENYATLKTLKNEIERIIKNYTPNQISKLNTIITADESIKMGFITDIKVQLRKAGITKNELKYYGIKTIYENDNKATPEEVTIQETDLAQKILKYNTLLAKRKASKNKTDSIRLTAQLKELENRINKGLEKTSKANSKTIQDKATPEEIIEYNNLAKYYNSLSKQNMIIKVKDLERLKFIYNKMTQEQKNEAEPFPDLPPPPPPVKISQEEIIEVPMKNPPPPPIPENATQEEKERMRKVTQAYAKKHPDKVTKSKDKDGKVIEIVEMPSDDKGMVKINNEDFYYITKDGETTYYNKYGKEVDSEGQQKNGYDIPPPPPPPTMDPKTVNSGSKQLQEVFKKYSNVSKSYVTAVKNRKGTKNNNNEITEKYKKMMELHEVYSKLATAEGILPAPPPPPMTPPNPTDHIIELAKKGALFYYEDKKITSDKAIELAKKNKSLHVQVLSEGSSKPIVKLSTK